MNAESHDRARNLLRAAQVESIPVAERRWLDAHLASCHSCLKDALSIAASIASLRGYGVTAPPGVVRRASLAVHERVQQERRARESMTILFMAVAASCVWAMALTPFVWAAVSRFGESLHLPAAVSLTGFLMCWLLPGTLLGAVAAWRRVAGEQSPDWATGKSGRQS